MGLATILAAAVKQVSWGKVATVAIQYGPDLIKRLKGQVAARHETGDDADVTVDELIEEIANLRKTVVNQEKIIEDNNVRIMQLERNCTTLNNRLSIWVSIAAVSVIASVVLGIVLLSR